jgi:hypothetical protein
MTIRISPDFSSFVVVDDEQAPSLVPLDPSRDAIAAHAPDCTSSARPDAEWARFPAFAADPGFRLIPESELRSFFTV